MPQTLCLYAKGDYAMLGHRPCLAVCRGYYAYRIQDGPAVNQEEKKGTLEMASNWTTVEEQDLRMELQYV